MAEGIYQILNTKSGKCYIGSSKNISRRWVIHKSALRNNRHHSIYLQRSHNKHGIAVFVFSVLEETCNLFEREQFWIDKILPEYNVGSVGGGDNTSNHPLNAEIRKKISEAQKGKPGISRYSQENPNWRGGKGICSICQIEIPRKNKSGLCKLHFTRYGDNNPFYNKQHSDKTKKLISEKNKGKTPANVRKVNIDGREFPNLTKAATHLGITAGALVYRLKSKNYPETTYVL